MRPVQQVPDMAHIWLVLLSERSIMNAFSTFLNINIAEKLGHLHLMRKVQPISKRRKTLVRGTLIPRLHDENCGWLRSIWLSLTASERAHMVGMVKSDGDILRCVASKKTFLRRFILMDEHWFTISHLRRNFQELFNGNKWQEVEELDGFHYKQDIETIGYHWENWP